LISPEHFWFANASENRPETDASSAKAPGERAPHKCVGVLANRPEKRDFPEKTTGKVVRDKGKTNLLRVKPD
jgi:hypothetical protein